MKEKIAKKWVKALRSGNYSQTTGKLCNPHGDSFCCLGVLTELYIQDQQKQGKNKAKTRQECGLGNEYIW